MHVEIRGLIKYNRIDKREVLYYQNKTGVYKMVTPKIIFKLSYKSLSKFFAQQEEVLSKSGNKGGTIIFGDEQPLFDGRTINVDSKPLAMRYKTWNRISKHFHY